MLTPSAMSTPLRRIEGPQKVTGTARYAAEAAEVAPLHLRPVQATIARGRVTTIDVAAARTLPGVVAVLTPDDAPRLADAGDPELVVLQNAVVHHYGQYIAAVVAETSEVAVQAAALVTVDYDEAPQVTDISRLLGEGYAPAMIANLEPADSMIGDADAALAAAPVSIRARYTTPIHHHSPMEPHASVARWDGDRVVLHEASQSVAEAQRTIATLFGLDEQDVEVSSPHVGGGFGTKGFLDAGTVLAVLAARSLPGRAVRFVLTRREMFETVGHRPATVQDLALGAERDGRLTAIVHEAVGHTARFKEYAEHTAAVSRTMYAAPHRRTTHRLVPLDVDTPLPMRGPGEAPGSFGAECAMDELAVALGLDPVELRLRNEPATHPENGLPWSSRNLASCLRRGADRFGWADRDPAPRASLSDGWWHGTGVAAAAFPTIRFPGSTASIRFGGDAGGGHYEVGIGAADIGQGARTVLTQIAADALGVPVSRVTVTIGTTAVPKGSMTGASSGTVSWGSTIVEAAERFRDKWGHDPDGDAEADASTPDNPWEGKLAMAAFGAQFAEVAVHADTGEIRVPRMLGVFAAGRILNPQMARSQFLGGMIWGLSMALHEESVLDPRFGHVVNHDFAGYHIASCADVGAIEAEWVEEDDPYVNPMGAKGIGEIPIVGVAAAIANAAYHATGVRVRSLPITVDAFL